MSATQTAASDFAGATAMTDELNRLRATLTVRLRHAGIQASDTVLADLAEEVLNDAVRVALRWLEERGESAAPLPSARG